MVGTSLDFSDGLNIIRADNSSGKSTCLQAIIYALGLEGMLSARREIPLPHAMTHAVDIDGLDFAVLESHVSLEIENDRGEVLTVRRAVKSDAVERSLVQTWEGPQLTASGDYPRRDYFVRRPGAAQREAGYQYRLANFVGWNIPQVSRLDGAECPLYLEAIFPFLYVEQKHGWSGIQARIPGYLSLRDPGKRAVEFILGLEAYSKILTRQRLISVRSMLEAEWKATIGSLRVAGEAAGIVISGLPERLSKTRRPSSISLMVSTGSGWISVDDALNNIENEIVRLAREETRTVADRATDSEAELIGAQRSLAENSALLSATIEELADVGRRRAALDARIEALEEDLQRHQDLNLLERLGSSHVSFLGELNQCPTCHQELHDGYEISHAVMSVAENLDFISQQLSTFRSMREDITRVVLALQAREGALRERVMDSRRSIRAYKDSLLEANATPSAGDLVARLRFEDRKEFLARTRSEIEKILTQLRQTTDAWTANERLIADMNDDPLSDLDKATLDKLQASVRDQLTQYEFRSLDSGSVEISRDTYRPIHEGFDLGFDLSASDMIRLIWAYLLGLFEVGRSQTQNHPRLLVFDEPRQQETARISFERLLTRSAQLHQDAAPGQIIFATSDDQGEIVRMLGDLPHRLISFPASGKILRAIP
ncbi:ATP-binding protein [Pseudofrankia sp. BMG5.36]|uniref:ATP-binding protein n=1 Tax=Pseudofrankia sp. BMG5.36 TaxID=1834512 RepID=UPI0012FF8C8F|nr:ATP-binding protein [Pseudofrankia sp. BMG5.36]